MDSTQIGVSCAGTLVESVRSEPEPTETGVRVFQSLRQVPASVEQGMRDDDWGPWGLIDALVNLRRFGRCATSEAEINALCGELVRRGLAVAEGDGYRITASGNQLGKEVLRHVYACAGTYGRALPDGRMERLCCPRCGGDLDLLQRGES